MASAFSVCLPIPEAIISINSFASLYPWLQSQDCYSILLRNSHFARGDVRPGTDNEEVLSENMV